MAGTTESLLFPTRGAVREANDVLAVFEHVYDDADDDLLDDLTRKLDECQRMCGELSAAVKEARKREGAAV